MINIDDKGFFEIFPAVKTITQAFEYQNSMLNKIVLTGKINALEIAENLFEFTEKTAETFSNLQEQLIENLLEESRKSIDRKAELKLHSILDILMHNLYEFYKSVDLLSHNRDVIEFLKGNLSRNEIKSIISEYGNKYTSCIELLLISPNKHIRANCNPKNRVILTKDTIVDEALKTDNILYKYEKTDMLLIQKNPFFVVKRVTDEDGEVLGVVALFLNLKDEMERVFKEVLNLKESFFIVDKFNNILATTETGADKKMLKGINKLNKSIIKNGKYYFKSKIEKSDSRYDIPNLYGVISIKREADLNILNEETHTNNSIKHLTEINVKNRELKQLTDNAYSILEDLSDVIINGELIAAKSKQYILIPILDNLREVSFKVVKLIEVSISSLQKVINESISNDILSISKFIIFSVIKRLYNVSNDIRWLALNRTFIKQLSSKNMDVNLVKKELELISAIYDNYYNIFIYNNKGEIIASLKDGEGSLIEDRGVFSNLDKNKFFVSEFKPTKFYNNKSTYIFYGSIIDNNEVIGGIGIVFDIKIINNIIDSVFKSYGFALIINTKKEILASSIHIEDKTMDVINSIELKDGVIKDIEIENKSYKLAVSYVNKYREYENRDLYSIVAIEK